MDKEVCKVKCDVCDCMHNEGGTICNREEIEITNKQKLNHYCKNYCKK